MCLFRFCSFFFSLIKNYIIKSDNYITIYALESHAYNTNTVGQRYPTAQRHKLRLLLPLSIRERLP